MSTINVNHILCRAWINQPSLFQQHHDLHGERVIVVSDEGSGFVRVFFAHQDADIVSQIIAAEALSSGWNRA